VEYNPPPHVVDSVLNDRSPGAELHHQLQELGIPKSLVRSGDGIGIGRSVSITVLHPPSGLIRSEADDKVLVVCLDEGEARAVRPTLVRCRSGCSSIRGTSFAPTSLSRAGTVQE